MKTLVVQTAVGIGQEDEGEAIGRKPVVVLWNLDRVCILSGDCRKYGADAPDDRSSGE